MYIEKNTEYNLINYLKKNKNKKVYILTGKNSYNLSGARLFFKKYLQNKKVNFFFKLKSYPVIEELKKIIIDLKKNKPEIIFAVGGGSVMDYAKIANCLFNAENLKKDIINSAKKFKKLSTLVAIPTSAGSGAEVTSNAVIYINKLKYSVEGKEIKPDKFFLIPKLIVKNKKNLKIPAGFDAISQSVESILSKKSNSNSLMYAKKSLILSLENYIPFINKPNYENSSKMLIASNLSGKAISISKTTAPHAVSYPLTAYFKIPHGNAVSITLDDFLLFNYLNLNKSNVNFDLKKRYEVLFRLTKTKNIYQLVKFIKDLKLKAGTENKFLNLNVNKNLLISKVLSGVNLQRLANNPTILTLEDIKIIFENKF